MLAKLKSLFSSAEREAQVQKHLEEVRQKLPVPVFWLFGKTQSGKTSIIRFLTGAESAEIGQGFRPTTRYSRQYQFPTPETPLVTFLDTRGLDEPDYDPQEDLACFNDLAHVVVVTVKALDHAQENVLKHLRTLRDAKPDRPVLLALTCLHEAYPQQQHPLPYPFDRGDEVVAAEVPEDLRRSLDEQKRRFEGLVDQVVPIDLTSAEEGFNAPNYGGEQLQKVLVGMLPSVYRQTLLSLEETTHELQDLYARLSLPHILGYATLAASAGAIPIPWIDLLILPGIQSRMIHHLSEIYGQPLNATRFLEIAGSLGMGLLVRQAVREVSKFIPFVGSVASGALAGASTFALGKAFCYYYSAVHQGHVPKPEDLKRYYQEQLTQAERHWTTAGRAGAGAPAPAGPPPVK
ncbi:MAG: DUF697 domain-containing protein [Planctomycetes bacterium]|nr:DUF697 domain-containing protein [Planctomycetota bacterium]